MSDLQQELLWWQTLSIWIFQYLLTTQVIIQLGVLVISTLLGNYIARLLRQYIASPDSSAFSERFIRSVFIRILRRLAFSLATLACLGIALLLYQYFDESDHLLIGYSTLIFAWAVIRLGSTFISNPTISHAISVIIWAITALYILGYLPLTIEWLQSFKLGDGKDSLTAYDIISSTLSIAFFMWLALIAAHLIERSLENNNHLTPSAQALFNKISKFSLIGIAFLLGLHAVGINLTAFAVLGGAVAVGIGLGLQKVFSNLIAGIILLLDKSIKPGDTLYIQGRYGKVHRLSARYVSMLTRDGTEHLIPNDELINQQVENWSYTTPNVRLRIPLSVHYKSDIPQAIKLCIDAAAECPRVLKDPPPNCLMLSYQENAVHLEQRIWIRDPMNGCGNIKSQVLLKTWLKFQEHGIETPYPEREVHLRTTTDKTSASSL